MAKQGQADRFHQGTMTDGWRWFRAPHPAKKRGRDGWMFRSGPHAGGGVRRGRLQRLGGGSGPPSPAMGEIWEGLSCRTCRSILPINMRCGGRTAGSGQKADPYGLPHRDPAGESQQAV